LFRVRVVDKGGVEAGSARITKGSKMENDIRRLSHAAPSLAYREVRDSARLQRSCERWPLLAAIHRALASDVGTSASVPRARQLAGAAALWEE
jgi:hypothetical protein